MKDLSDGSLETDRQQMTSNLNDGAATLGLAKLSKMK